MKIAVVGTGYVGLVTGTCLADIGNVVICVDIDKSKVEKMRRGVVPIYEPELERMFVKNIKEKRLSFTTSLSAGVKKAEAIILALPTPPRADGAADLSYILKVAKELGTLLDKYAVIIDKSTIPVGTSKLIRKEVAKNAKTEFDVVSNPEFLREGLAVSDFMKPDRIVIGVESKKARQIMAKLYGPFFQKGSECIYMDPESAELTKYAANTFLAMKISFMNEVANLCELTGADANCVRLGIGSDDRIGKKFLFPGIGYGGSCFPKDVLALSDIAKQNNYDFKLLKAVHAVNKRQKKRLYQKLNDYYAGNLSNRTFAIWGLAFKPDTDDIREAPAIELIDVLLSKGSKLVVFDPEAMPNTKKRLGESAKVRFAKDAYSALSNADALIIATEWSEFLTPDFKLIKAKLKQPVIFDGRNVYDLQTMEKEGFHYESIGRRIIK